METLTRAFVPILYLHITCVALSGALFLLRGGWMLTGSPLVDRRSVKLFSYTVDTLLLTAAIALTLIVHQYPFVHAWLTVKVVLLAAYIVLGTYALRRGKSLRTRAICLAAALAVYGFIISVAITKNPWGLLAMFA